MRHAALLLTTAILGATPASAVEMAQGVDGARALIARASQAPTTEPSLETAILAYKAHLAKDCPAATFSRGFSAGLDLNGDGRPDAIMSSQYMDCSSGLNGWQGSAGSATRFVVSRADGTYATHDGIYHKTEPLLEAGGFHVLLSHHGSVCNRTGVEACTEVVRFDGDAMTTLSWPDGREVRFDPKRSVAGTTQTPSQRMVRVATAGPLQPTASFDIAGEPWTHNGSVVRIDTTGGTIIYDNPKVSIRSVVRHGTMLFKGRISESGPVGGTAYAFKDGCDPAPYSVRGRYDRETNTIVLRGMGPIRSGCEVVAYSERTPHSVLVFNVMMSD